VLLRSNFHGEETDVMRSNGTTSGRREAMRELLTRATVVGLLVLTAATPVIYR
jgi:hypothetical protein